MKSFMILGAILGFLIGGGFSLAEGCAVPTVLWRACAAALVAGILGRWWGGIWLHNLRDAIQQRRRPASISSDVKSILRPTAKL